MKWWLQFLIIFLVGLVVFFPTLELSFYGDDWLVFWRYDSFFPSSQVSNVLDYLNHFLTRYGSQDMLMGLLRSIYGYNPTYYYLFSLILRILAAFSLYPLTFYLTKNKLATFFAVLFFSVTTIGLETTEYLPHITSYVGLAFFNLFLYFFLSSREEKESKKLLYSGIFFFLVFVIVPIRMTGLLPFIILIETFWIIQNLNGKIFKKFAVRLSFILLIFLFINIVGNPFFFPSPGRESQSNLFLINQTTHSLFNMLEQLKNGRFDFLFYPIISFGSMFIPDTTLAYSQDTKLLILSLVGGLIILLGFYLLFKFYRNNFVSTAIFISLSWSILAFFVPWFWDPTYLLISYHRYLIGSAVGISLFLAIIISLAKSPKHQKIILSLFFFLLLIHIANTSMYIKKLQENRNQEISRKIWSQIPYISAVGQSDEPLVFYFEGDGTNDSILHNTVTFGFPFHMAILYGITDENRNPISMIEWKDVASAVLDGKSFAPHAKGKVLDPISSERVYAFRLQGKDNLVNITDVSRKKLIELVQNEQ